MNLTLAHPEDVQALPLEARRECVAALKAIDERPEAPYGLVVGLFCPKPHAVGMDPLQGMLVARFGSGEQPYRIVYRLEEDGCEVVAVGPRVASKVYRLAVDRLQEQRPVRRIRTTRRRTAA